jgi:DNA-binding MarR family transcriptional regulator
MGAKADQEIAHLIVLTGRLQRVLIGQKLSEIGLFPGQERAIEVLAAHGPMQMGELAAKLSVRPPTISKTVTRLTTQGLVERRAGAGDGRLVAVSLTSDGEAKARELEGLTDSVTALMLDELDGKDRKRLRKALRRMTRALSAAGGRDTTDLAEADDGDDEA